MNKILYTDDLARELLKHPRRLVCMGQQDSDSLRTDRHILNTYLRSDGTLILNYEDYEETGVLRNTR